MPETAKYRKQSIEKKEIEETNIAIKKKRAEVNLNVIVGINNGRAKTNWVERGTG